MRWRALKSGQKDEPMTRQLRGSAVRLVLASALASVLVLAGTTVAAVPSDASTGRPEVVEADKPVPGHPIKVTPRERDPAVVVPPPAAVWPVAGRASASVPTVSSGEEARAPLDGLPIALRAPSGAGAAAGVAREKSSASAAAVPASVATAEITVESPAAAGAAQVNGMLLTARRTDDVAEPGSVGLEIDYSRFAQVYGGGYGSRLRLIQLPACVLTTPDQAQCRAGVPVAATNDSAGRTLTAAAVTLPAAAATGGGLVAVLAVTAGAAGDGGDYGATPLSPSATWQMGLNAGSFSWSYPMPAPVVPGGLAPVVGISYSSGGVDGRTSTTNNQSSWAGDGFEAWPGFIERGYKSCSDDGAPATNGVKPFDRCWGYDNATLSLNGQGGELIPAGANRWKLKDDDGTRVEKLKGSATDVRDNGDDDQEYWRVTTTDGTQYYFGYHKLPGWSSGKESTDSTWAVPVYGNNADEPCHAATFAASWCQQAWRWNLDYVVDTHGNAIAYYYNREGNSYSRNLIAADDTAYTRGGTLERIEYGLRSDAMYAAKPLARVVFGSAERCLPVSGVTCAPDTIATQSAHWYDTPWDRNCKAGADCTSFAPTFWTRNRLTSVTTQVLAAGGSYADVDSWAFTHVWGMADIDYQLLLDSIQHTGKSATPHVTLPKVTFDYRQGANRLDKQGDGTAPFIKARLGTVVDESGGQIDVTYSAAACDWGKLPAPETNTTRCYPVYSTASGDLDPSLQWFNKYVVVSVTQSDRTNASPDRVTRYDYLDDAAWHFDDDDGLTKEKYKTWSQWRGYRRVRVQSGGTSGMLSQSDHYFQRGMHGDRRNTDGGTKPVTFDNGEGVTLTDWEALAGFEYRTEQYSGPGGRVLSKTVHHGWFHQSAVRERSWGTTAANLSGTDVTQSFVSLDNGAGLKWRQTLAKNTLETTAGRITQSDDLGDITVTGDERCTRVTFLDNTDANLLMPARTETVAVDCGTAPKRGTQVISDVRLAYDGSSYTAVPTKGVAWYTATLKSHDGTTGTYLESGATYDRYGRELTSTDLTANLTATNTGVPARTARTDGRTTKTVYSPSTGIPTSTTVTTPPADPAKPDSALSTTTSLEALRGAPLTVTDINGKRTKNTYDALGRVLKTWLADRADNLSPNVEHTYTIADDAPVAVGTKTLNNDNTQDTSYLIYDGFLNPRQSQEPGPDGGSVVADTFYDERGLTAKEFAPYYMTSAPSKTLTGPDKALSVEAQTWHTYDGLGRETQQKQVAGNGDGGTVLATTTTTYGGDRITVTPPTGGTTTTTLFDSRGQSTELWQYHTPAPTGTPDKTRYGYTPAGQLASITDTDDNSWSYSYDQLGRQREAKDPDTGTSSFAYDDRGLLQTSTDSRSSGNTLAYVYDGLGRRTALHAGSATGTKLAGWTYDTAYRGKGLLASATRYDNGHPYTTTIDTYDALDRVTRSIVSIPAAEGALAGSYDFDTKYNPDGTLMSAGLPPQGSLPGETVTLGYDSVHRPITVSGTSAYLTDTRYSLTGRPQQYELATTATGAKHTWLTLAYEWGTQRLKTSRVDREDVAGVDRFTTYGYDQIGDITSIADTSRDGTDNQCFAYDALQRLLQAWAQNTTACAATPSASVLGGPAPYWQSWTYGATGNRDTQTDHHPSGDTAKDVKQRYTYPDPKQPQPHTLTQTDTTGPNGGTARNLYGYDPAGRTITRTLGGDQQVLTWDTEGNLTKVAPAAGHTGATTSYLYDADGTRLIKRTDTATTLYLGGTEITLLKGATAATATRYYDLGNGVQAVRTNDNTVSFVVPDHHATGELAIDAATLALRQRRTTPFGDLRGTEPTGWPGTKGFVGGTDDPTTGLTHLGAREYDPAIGRFISADPILVAGSPQQMNGYAYSDNNPVTTSDPTGLCAGSLCSPGGGALGGGMSKDPDIDWTTPDNKAGGTSPDVDTRDDWMVNRSGIETRDNWMFYPEVEVKAPKKKSKGRKFWDIATKAGGIAFSLMDPRAEIQGCGNLDPIDCAMLLPWGKPVKAAKKIKEAAGAAKKTKPKPKPKLNACRDSFPAGTLVLLADGTVTPIEKLKLGDDVAATDPQTSTSGPRDIDATIVTPNDTDFTTITINTQHQPSSITATDHHSFWSPSAHAWINAGDLKPGMTLRSADGHNLTITATRHFHRLQTAYNLTIRGLHTYYVLAGTVPVLVHNAGLCTEQIDSVFHNPSERTSQAQFEFHWDKHARKRGVTREQYLQDAKGWATGIAQPGGKMGLNARLESLVDGLSAIKYVDPKTGKGGIIGPDGKVVSFWYGVD
ncbi:RHS repeat-associated core domain-containing protein [Nonomuraea sp. NPDC002799]